MRKEKTYLQRMEIPELYWECSYDIIPKTCCHMEHVTAYRNKIEEAVEDGVGLYLWGDRSTGKTALSTLLLRDLIPLKKFGLFVMGSDIPDMIFDKKLFDLNTTYYSRLLSVDLLVIDEVIFTGKDSQREMIVETVIRKRGYDRKATILTSNISTKDMKLESPNLFELVQESILPVKCIGHNFRSDIKEANKKRFL